MANGEVWEEIRKLAENEGALSDSVFKRLALAGMADVYEALGEIKALRTDVEKLKNDNKWIVGRDVTSIVIGLGALLRSFFT